VPPPDLCHDDPVRSRTAWLLTLPLLLVSETVGHAFVVRVFDPHDGRHGLFLHAVRDYLEYAHAALAIFLAAAAVLLARRAVASFRQVAPRPLPSWRLAAIPSLAFLVQEHLEHLAHDGSVGWLTAAEPAVAIGVALQLPCGLLAVWLVRTLLRAADQLGWALARRGAAGARQLPQDQAGLSQAAPLRLPVLAGRHAGRAPPAFA
jgi:hypothetical protein